MTDIIGEKIIELLEQAGPVELEGRYRIGQASQEPPASELPLCMIHTEGGVLMRDGVSREQRDIINIQLQVLTNFKNEIQTSQYDYGQQAKMLIEDRDEKYQLRDRTILKVLFDNIDDLSIEGVNIFFDPNNQGFTRQYQTYIRGSNSADHTMTATIDFNVEIS